MRALAIGLIVLSGACTAGETHFVDETNGFCLTVPDDFHERRVRIVGENPQVGTDRYDLVAEDREVPPTLTIGVNDYDLEFPEDKVLIEYAWRLTSEGTLEPMSRHVTVPEGAISYPPIAVSLFFDKDKDLHYFRMDLDEDGFEDLFVDIVGSYQSLR